ncbi:MAG: ATP-binding protein [Candidatus ainarchaeum sp.]|nr:ATP-binding protein [Candidatus ainarchaeum sp.]
MGDFKNRINEVSDLKETISKKGFAFEIIYGRRRVGKTELILHSTINTKKIYYLAVGENNLERFYAACIEFDSKIKNLRMDYEILFDYLKDNVDVLIIDEFQNMFIENKNFLNLLQAIIDTKLKKSNLKLFILGSSISMITSRVLNYSSPVFGRRTASLNLKPVSFFDLKYFFPNKSFEELIEIYGFADGIPFYLTMIDKPFWDWLDAELQSRKSFIKDEVDFLMKLEFDNSSTYKLILEAIANGKNTINEIKNFIKFQRTDISPYIKNLIEVGFIERRIPITENVKSRLGKYYLNDKFLRFWFKYIYPNINSIEQGLYKSNLIKQNYAEYLGFVFEDVCKQFLIKKRFSNFSKIGGWWYKDIEIDIVAFNQNKEILFCECKWKKNVNALKIVEELSTKTSFFDWNNGSRKEEFVIFAKTFSKKINSFNGKKVYCFEIKDLVL